jgi:apolipoprotein N-acyltransferase
LPGPRPPSSPDARPAPWRAARRTLLWLLVAAAGGLVWALQFERRAFVVASWLALAPLVLLLSARRAGLLAFVHGLVSWTAALAWIPPTLVTFGGIPKPLSIALAVLLAAYLALYHAAFGALGARLWRRGGLLPFAALPALWVALEWLRTYLGGGFPWNLAAYAWVAVPGALQSAAWIGAYGVSFLVVLAATGVAASVARRRWEPLAAGVLLPLLVLGLAGRSAAARGAGLLAPFPGPGVVEGADAIPRIESPLPIRLVQPNIANLRAYDEGAVEASYRRLLAMTRPECEEGTLVVWPESAAWPYSFDRDPPFAADVQSLVSRGCTLVFNSTHEAGETIFNSAYLLSPGGAAARYDKRHLVPFGEYVPFRDVFSFVRKLAREAGTFEAGSGVHLLPWGRERLGMSICYEVVFPAEVAELVRGGATILTTITNDAWYGDTAAPWQHLRAARFRAAESRRPMLRAAITGVSALIAPDGSIAADLPLFRQGVIRARVAGRTALTPYTRHPALVPALASAVAAFAIIAAYARRRRPAEDRPARLAAHEPPGVSLRKPA